LTELMPHAPSCLDARPCSNMQFTVHQITDDAGWNASAEIAAAANYPGVRTMTVGQVFTSATPLLELGAPPTLPWSVASPAVIGSGDWNATSATCWFYGKQLADALGVPVGLISTNWGGTVIPSWSDEATNAACGFPPNITG
jgi:sialate O-acetylesterase